MAINGVQTAIFGVDDLDLCTRFFSDFGLDAVAKTAELTDFRLPEGSHVILRRSDDPTLPAHYVEGPGVREVIWGVDSADSLREIENELVRDRKVTRDADGIDGTMKRAEAALRHLSGFGIAAECGLGRCKTADDVRSLLYIHAAAAEKIAGLAKGAAGHA